MNRQITRLAVFSVLLLVALIVATTYWQTWAAAGLADRQDNAVKRVAEFRIKRGLIYAADGRTVLAKNVARKVDGRTLFFRRYPTGTLAPHVVGYSTQTRSRAGLERSENDYLTAANKSLRTVFRTTLDRLKGVTISGNTLVTTLDAKAQAVANRLLQGQCGSAVALEPTTGRVLVMSSSPTYDPNLVERHFNQIGRVRANCSPPAPLVNRATFGLYTPGSIFKVVTAAAALDSGRFHRESEFDDPGYCIEYGKRVTNFSDQSGPEVFGHVNFTQAMQHSINAVFCNIGKALGALTVLDYAKRFGFYSVPPLETPVNERAPSGLYQRDKLFRPRQAFQVDPGRLAFGQERLSVTPLQMTMVTAAIANEGTVMQPYVVERVVGPDRHIVARTKPKALGRAIKPETAATLTAMMEAVVTGGTGTAAQLSEVRVAGKTGTAETGVSHRNTTWFICFAPAEAPRVAIAVVLENQQGTGGATAAPIARELMQALLSSRSNS
jgi:peptidoglycan glycosyltransferase